MSVLLLFCSVILGGATYSGFLSDVLLQILSIPLLLAASWLWLDRFSRAPAERGAGGWISRLSDRPDIVLGLAMCTVGTLIVLAQFVPLFGSARTPGLVGEIAARGGDASANFGTGSSSLDPAASRAAVAALIPALALFLLVALLDGAERMRLVGWIVLLGLISLALGVLQVLQGPSSGLRFFTVTNTQEAVGFFANRNHFAAQLYITLLFGAVWLARRCAGLFAGRKITSTKTQWIAISLSFVLLVLGGIALARSRAGILLTFLAFIPFICIAPSIAAILIGRSPKLPRIRRWIVVGGGAIFLLIAVLGADRVLPRFEAIGLNEVRPALTSTTLEAAVDALPFGTGLATFMPVYQLYEADRNLLSPLINRAHDDWAEFFLEAGIPGALLMLLFLTWYALRSVGIWFAGGSRQGAQARLLERAASLAILLLLLHSFVDYPLRTAGILGYFSLCCALLTPVARKSRADSTAVSLGGAVNTY